MFRRNILLTNGFTKDAEGTKDPGGKPEKKPWFWSDLGNAVSLCLLSQEHIHSLTLQLQALLSASLDFAKPLPPLAFPYSSHK